MASTQELEMLRRQLDELIPQMIEMRQQSVKHCDERSGDRTHGSRENNGTVGVETAPRGHESESQSRTHLAQDFDDWDFTFNGCAGMLDPAYPALLKTARQSPTVVMATPPHEQHSLQPCSTFSRCSHRKEHGKK